MSDSSDIVAGLNGWGASAGRRATGETADIEIELVRRAIAEIKALREKLDPRRTARSIAAEDLNASNDE